MSIINAEEPTQKQTEGSRARCCWEVVAGIIPGTPIPEYTRRWVITSEYWECIAAMGADELKALYPDEKSDVIKYHNEAYEYARELTDPRGLNWVRVEWIWF